MKLEFLLLKIICSCNFKNSFYGRSLKYVEYITILLIRYYYIARDIYTFASFKFFVGSGWLVFLLQFSLKLRVKIIFVETVANSSSVGRVRG